MKNLALLFFLFGIIPACGQTIKANSPDGRITFFLSQTPLHYSVAFKGKLLVENGEIGLAFNGHDFARGARFRQPIYRKGIEEYELIVGKAKKIKEAFNEVIIPLRDKTNTTQVNVVVRIFNDGLGLRYEFIHGYEQDSLMLTDEHFSLPFAYGTGAITLQLPGYVNSHEGFYSTARIDKLKEGSLMDLPALLETPSAIFCAITEAALVDYAGMYLTTQKGLLQTTLSPWPGQQAVKVKSKFPHKSPWRVFLISDRVGALIESNLITNLNEPPASSDWSWLKPGKTTFPWWNGNVLPDTLNAPGNNFVTQQYYIDFCARNKIEYHTVVEYGLHQWYVDDGVSFSPGPHADATRAVPGLDMKAVCDYAKSKGVGIRVWVHWAALYPKLDSAFANYERWGLAGMMVDFMDRDDQQMVNIQNEILRKAAQHHLHVQFHGAYKPTGTHRTWPNELTREGTLNYEINKWDSHGLPPDHDIMIPFTRMLAGSTDYHLGGFRSVPGTSFRRQYTRPLMLGTRAHMMAMYVVLENYLGMVCDFPDAYEGQPGFDFLKDVPTVWDETEVLDAQVGEYIVVARRKGADWYVGAITNHASRTISIAMNFLSAGSYTASIYTDAADTATHPDHINEMEKMIVSTDNINVKLAEGGGMTMIVRRK